MQDVVVTSGVRTAIGRFQGSLAGTPASDLGAAVIREAISRSSIESGQVEQVLQAGKPFDLETVARSDQARQGRDQTMAGAAVPPAGGAFVRHGLGLPLTKALVEANRAYFELESTLGEGTVVHVLFPSQRVLAD